MKADFISPRRRKLSAATFSAMLCVVNVGALQAQGAPDSENGRYTFSPVGGDFLRLDTRTGAVSTCSNKGGWICRGVPDERAALDSEIGKLQAENRKLKEQLAQRDANSPPDKNSAEAAPGGKIELQLPADHQKLMALLDRVWGRLVEMASQVQKRLSERI